MAGMDTVLTIAGVMAGGLFGILGLYLGLKLRRFRPHRKSEEIETVFTRDNLD